MNFKAFIQLLSIEPKKEEVSRTQDFLKCDVNFGLGPRDHILPLSGKHTITA